MHEVDRDQPVAALRTLEQVVADSVAARRFNLLLLGLFAALALMLAAVGIYGVTSYSVVQRTRELGLRMALGAPAGSVLRLLLAEAGALVGLGLLIGLAAAFVLTRVMASLLFGVGATDPATFAGVGLALMTIALFSAWVPGRRATRVDPIVALRADSVSRSVNSHVLRLPSGPLAALRLLGVITDTPASARLARNPDCCANAIRINRAGH